MRSKWKTFLPLAALGALALAAAPIHATTCLLLDESELALRAKTILHGDVTSRASFVTDGGRIYTEYRFRPRDVLKGSAGADGQVTFREWGGEVNGIHYWLPGVGEFREGDEVVAFLGETDPRTGVGFTTGLAQGKFLVTRDAAGARVRRDLGHLVLLDQPGGAPARSPAASDERNLDAFKASVRGYLKR